MNTTDFIRFAFALSDGQATTFGKNLLKIVKLVLFDCFGSSISISEITKRICITYTLEFSDSEIMAVIEKDRTMAFISTRLTKDPYYFSYTITPNEYGKLIKLSSIYNFPEIVQRFALICNSEIMYSNDEMQDIIIRYIYFVFNNDINTVLSLLNYKDHTSERIVPIEHFTSSEIILINSFLNWDDEEKNRYVFTIISSCYDYCMMTVKKDNASFANIFRGKEFFLDSNIIFRLAGFNNNERREIVELFINKCKECGVSLKITNFTNVEINSTLSYQVDSIYKLLDGQSPICVNAMKKMSSKYANLDFYSHYVEWTQKVGHKIGDYSSFLKDLKRIVEKHIHSMGFAIFEAHESLHDNSVFFRLCDEYRAYKALRNKNTFEGSIKVDVENYMYLNRLNSSVSHNSFIDKKHYFITADHTYIDWANGKMPGVVPTFVLPSVWYSIMLKYSGRTANDYVAFCHFLNLRISQSVDLMAEKKKQILDTVLGLDESVTIKEEIIFDIDQRLQNYPDVVDVEQLVSESHQEIIDIRIHDAVLNAKKSHYDDKKALTVDAEQRITRASEENRRTGIEIGTEAILEKLTNIIAKRNKVIKISVVLLLILSIIIGVVLLFILSTVEKALNIGGFLTFLNNNAAAIFIFDIGITVLSSLFSILNKLIDFLPTNHEIVKSRVKARYKK